MNYKVKKVFTALFSILASGFILSDFISCKSAEVEVIDVPYTEKDALSDEINTVKKLSENFPVKALWRAFIIVNRCKELNELESVDASEKLLKYCSDLCVEKYNSFISEKDYFEALKIYQSFQSIGLKTESFNMNFNELNEKINGPLKKLKVDVDKASKVSDMINGTVTVYVDKGIKVEKGAGRLDSVLGSGFFITKDGYIVTNHHVINDMVDKKYEGFSRLYIKLAEDPETRIPAKVVGYDKTLDLALLKTEIEAPYVFTLGSSSDLEVGDRVFAIGSPLGLEKTLTSGIISSTDRRLFTCGHVFQIDAAVNSGNSGGPLIDEAGRVQAIVFAGVQNYQGLNFAIPVEYLKTELPYLFKGGEINQSWINAYGKTKRKAGSGAVNEGVLINYVMNDGSAFRSGLKEEFVINEINGEKITSLDELQLCFMKYDAGTILNLRSLDKNEKIKDHYVYLEKRPENPGYEIYKREPVADSLYPIVGLKLVSTSSFYKRKFNVVSVLKGSPADEVGFSENDPIELLGIDINEDKTSAYVQLNAKKRKNGYLDVNIGLPVSLDSPYYF